MSLQVLTEARDRWGLRHLPVQGRRDEKRSSSEIGRWGSQPRRQRRQQGVLQAASRPGLCRAARLLARGAAPGASRATVACGVKRNYAVSRASSRVPSRASLALCYIT